MFETGSIMGYEYGYRFWMDKSIIERFSLRPNVKFVFERRTYFVVKRSDGGGGDEIVDSERVEFVGRGDQYEVKFTGKDLLNMFWSERLKEDYWMSSEEVRELTRKAADFARQKQKELADDDDVSLPFIPIAVELDVCTVQKAGEPISDTYGRALRSQHMYPLSLNLEVLHIPLESVEFVRKGIQIDRVINVEDTLDYWMVGVENVDQEADWREEVCRLCAQKPTIGAQIALLHGCFHRFHHHCIVEWLLKYEKSCPSCRRNITKRF